MYRRTAMSIRIISLAALGFVALTNTASANYIWWKRAVMEHMIGASGTRGLAPPGAGARSLNFGLHSGPALLKPPSTVNSFRAPLLTVHPTVPTTVLAIHR
jgi:hypothetical protein